MIYIYDDYEVRTTTKSYICICDDEKVRVPKSVIEKFEDTGEDLETITICIAIIELTRVANKEADKVSQPRFITSPDFEIGFKKKLKIKTVEEIIQELAGMKYHEMQDYFNPEMQ